MGKANKDRYILPVTIVNEIKQAKSNLSIIIEGETDYPFFRNMTIHGSCSFFISAGKENLIGAIELLNKDAEYSKPFIGIVDKDFDAIDSAPKAPTYPDHVFVTDNHDRELMCLVPHIRERFYCEYFLKKELKTQEWLEEQIISDARVFGYFQLANHREKWGMTTKNPKDEYMNYGKFYDEKLNLLSYDQIAIKINNNHPVNPFDANVVAQKMVEIKDNPPSDCDLLNGHQIGLILIEYMAKYGERKPTYKHDDVGHDIRMAYTIEDFHSTELYSSLHKYEESIEHQFLK